MVFDATRSVQSNSAFSADSTFHKQPLDYQNSNDKNAAQNRWTGAAAASTRNFHSFVDAYRHRMDNDKSPDLLTRQDQNISDLTEEKK